MVEWIRTSKLSIITLSLSALQAGAGPGGGLRRGEGAGAAWLGGARGAGGSACRTRCVPRVPSGCMVGEHDVFPGAMTLPRGGLPRARCLCAPSISFADTHNLNTWFQSKGLHVVVNITHKYRSVW